MSKDDAIYKMNGSNLVDKTKAARDKYWNLSEQKNKKKEYGKNRYRNMSEEIKQRLKKY